jgi:demethylmenaquinone methyltransferase/2-methoxy-6-polyprenyl-1,4-benzoquinol methylase
MQKTGLSMNKMELPFIREMFDAISPKYDLLNRLLSLRQDVCWRREMVRAMQISDKGMVLDVACGTGDVALEIVRQKGSGVTIFGADFSPGMLRLAKNKIRHSGIHLLVANAFHLPFRAETFDAVTIAFGIRNIADKLSVLKAFHEHLKPGGMLLVLELATPPKGMLLSLYLFYFKKILPMIGWFFSKNLMAYKYLPASVMNFPQAPVFAGLIRAAGFSDVRWRCLTFGIATLYAGRKM